MPSTSTPIVTPPLSPSAAPACVWSAGLSWRRWSRAGPGPELRPKKGLVTHGARGTPAEAAGVRGGVRELPPGSRWGRSLIERQASRPMAGGIWAWQPIGALWAVPAGEGGGAGASRTREAARWTPPPAEVRPRPPGPAGGAGARGCGRCGAGSARARSGQGGRTRRPSPQARGFPRPVLLPVAATPRLSG